MPSGSVQPDALDNCNRLKTRAPFLQKRLYLVRRKSINHHHTNYCSLVRSSSLTVLNKCLPDMSIIFPLEIIEKEAQSRGRFRLFFVVLRKKVFKEIFTAINQRKQRNNVTFIKIPNECSIWLINIRAFNGNNRFGCF